MNTLFFLQNVYHEYILNIVDYHEYILNMNF